MQNESSYTAEHRLLCSKKYFKQGIEKILKNRYFPLILGLYLFLFIELIYSRFYIFCYSSDMPLFSIFDTLVVFTLTFMTLLVTFIMIIGVGIPANSLKYYRAFRRINFNNAAGEAPILLSCTQRPDNIKILTFLAQGIPLSMWEDKKAILESALNLHIAIIYPGLDIQHIEIKAVDGSIQLPTEISWNNSLLSSGDFILKIGESYLGSVEINLVVIPHLLIGGGTGSGKSVLLRNLLYQALQKGAEIVIADFKQGADFGSFWQKHCKVVMTLDELIIVLENIINNLEHRKALFREAETMDIVSYNKYAETPLPHLIFACDEAAELLDKSGATKETKEKITKVESYISTIARTGRSFGIHCFLATQRPDANVLSGQIKNNIGYRICGRADQVLSQIILDNTNAADQIPKNAQGRFLDSDGVLLQGYKFDDSMLTD